MNHPVLPSPTPTSTPTTTPRTLSTLAAVAALAGLSAGCMSLPVAEIEAPAPLAQASVQIFPAAHARSGRFEAVGTPAVAGQFTRGADRLSVFETLDFDRAALSLQFESGGGSYGYRCTLRRTSVQVGVLATAPRPMQLRCRDEAGQRQLQLDEQARATRVERQGQFSDGRVTLQIESLHRLSGSPLPLEQAGGYLLRLQGEPVAVLDLLDRAPRLRSVAQDTAVQTAVRDAALLLALHWDPAR